jgi:hypothetical protein
MANFTINKEAIRLCMDAKITSCLWGHRGIGKSSLVREIANEGYKENETAYPLGFIDFRCGQIEASDLRGLPDKISGRTTYLPPAELPQGDRTAQSIAEELETIPHPEHRRQRAEQLQPHYERGILFLDEVNRGQDDVMQAVFQLIQDRRIGQYVLPEKWSIVLAANHMQGDYNTNGFTDAAFLDRMCHLQLSATNELLEEWCGYISDHHGAAGVASISFCASNLDHWLGKVEGDLGFIITPSPRSWERVILVENAAKQGHYSDKAREQVIMGLIGPEVAAHYFKFSCPVKPQELLRDGVERWKPELLKLDRQGLIGVAMSLATLARDRLTDNHVVDTILDFIDVLLTSPTVKDKDVVIGFCRITLKQFPFIVHCLTNRDFAKSAAKIRKGDVGKDGGANFISRLYAREELHKKLSSTGWGSI